MPHAAGRWRYFALGTNRLVSGERVVEPERKTAALLAYLALEGTTPRSKLAGLLWPASEEGTARNNLSQTLRRFRNLSDEPLLVVGDSLGLGDRLEVDAAELKRAALAGNAAAVAEYRGELLAPFDYDDLPELSEWLWGTREALAALVVEALGTLVTSAETQGRFGDALRYAERLLEVDPVSEVAHRHAMRLHYLLGDRPAALRAYHRCQTVLKRELAVEPLPETAQLARLIAQGQGRSPQPPVAARPLPPQVLRPPVLVGREALWAQLEAAWARGRTIYVTGEPGVGKTRLVQEFVASKGRGLYLPAGPGYQDVLFAGAAGLARTRLAAAPEVTLPQWVTRELSRILPEFRDPDPLPPLRSEDDKLRFYQAYVEMVRLTGAGFVATISDDTQYYDPATVELGGFMIAQRPAQAPGAAMPRLLIIYRTGELSEGTQRYIDQFVDSELAVRVELGPLDARSTTSLLVSLNLGALEDGVTPALAETVHRRTGGNPLFILETLRDLLETDALSRGLPERLPLPHKVGAAVQGRLARLSPSAQRVVQAAAVLQSDFDVELIAKILGGDALALLDIWEELERAHIMSGDRFSHDLLYEAVTATVSPSVAALLNRRCAEVLAERGATPARVAKHYLASGDEEKAAPYLVEAARRAKDAFRLAEAAERYERAGGILGRLGDPQGAFDAYRAALKVRLEFDLGGRFDDTLAHLRKSARTPLMRTLAWRLAAERELQRGDHAAVEAAARRGLAELGEAGDARARTELLTLLAGALARQGHAAESLATLEAVFALTEGLADPAWLAPQLSRAAAILDDLGRNRDAFGYHRRALALEGSPRRRLPQLADYGFSLLAYGDARGALETLLEAKAQLAGVTDAPVTEGLVLTYLGAAQHHLGHYVAALAAFEEALALSERHRHVVQSEGTRVRRARLYLTLGQPDEAAADLAAAQDGAGPRHLYQVHLEATLGRLRALQGGDAAEVFARVEARLKEVTSPRVLALVRLEQAVALPREARSALAEEVLALSRKLELPGLDIGAMTLDAQRLLALGDLDAARTQGQRAVSLLERYASVYLYPGEVLLTHFQALAALDDPEAQRALAQCVAFLEGAIERVPEAYRSGYLEKNPVNCEIIAAARRAGLPVNLGQAGAVFPPRPLKT